MAAQLEHRLFQNILDIHGEILGGKCERQHLRQTTSNTFRLPEYGFNSQLQYGAATMSQRMPRVFRVLSCCLSTLPQSNQWSARCGNRSYSSSSPPFASQKTFQASPRESQLEKLWYHLPPTTAISPLGCAFCFKLHSMDCSKLDHRFWGRFHERSMWQLFRNHLLHS